MSLPFPRLRATAIDGRQHTIYHRQEQLEGLCKALISNIDQINSAIATDYGHSPSEIALEISLVLRAVKHYYALLDPRQALEQEYLIAKGKDAERNRVPAGIVYVEPTTHTLFFSAVVPLAAALAAGNCVVLLLENNLRTLSSLLRRILTEALDPDVFAIASSPVEDQEFLDQAICVFQNGSDLPSSHRRLVSSPQLPVVAVVDRTADLQLAARKLVAARFSFGGGSPYAPDVVLVNEFVKEEFLRAVVDESKNFSLSNRKEKNSQPSLEKDPNQRIVLQEHGLTVVEVPTRDAIFKQKTRGPVLVTHTTTSLDDATDLISSKMCLAAYHFSNLPSAKYLAQFIPAEVSFVNHIPRELLMGPAAPSGQGFGLERRYEIEMFQVGRPVLVERSAESRNVEAEVLLSEAREPLKEMKRNPGGGVGFFEQGFLINAGLILASTLTISATGVLWLWRYYRAV